MAKPSKTPQIEQFINSNIGSSFTTKDMCVKAGVSLPTLLEYIKNNSYRFEGVKYGTYLIKPVSNSTSV